MNFETLRSRGFDPASLLSPDDALTVYFKRVGVPALRIESVDLAAALSRVLACEVEADSDYPRADRSAMDGFAVRSADTPGTLRLTGAVTMGFAPADELPDGAAMRIPTGGMLPSGADAVVPIESTQPDGDGIRVPRVSPRDAVDAQGSDMRCGATVLGRGTRVGPAEIGLLATVGVQRVAVFAKPRIGVLSSGDELVVPGGRVGRGQVRDSNRYAVAAALQHLGAEPVHLPTSPDDPAELAARLREGLAACDGVLLTGGSSVGERDFAPAVIAELGAPGVLVHGLRVKPGKPTVLGAVGSKPVIGLPGNPGSALAIFYNVAAPILARLTGLKRRTPRLPARLASAITKRPGWTWFVPVALETAPDGELLAEPLPMDSGHVGNLARATGFAVLGETVTIVEAGAPVSVVLLSMGESL